VQASIAALAGKPGSEAKGRSASKGLAASQDIAASWRSARGNRQILLSSVSAACMRSQHQQGLYNSL